MPVLAQIAREVSREQAVHLGVTLGIAVVIFLFLLRVSKWQHRRDGRGSGGLTSFAAFVYVPLVVMYLSLGILGVDVGITNTVEVEAGKPPEVGLLMPAKVLKYLVFVIGVYVLTSFVDGILFTAARERELGWKVPRILRDTIRWTLLLLAALFIAGEIFNLALGQLSIFAGALTIALSLALGPTLGSLFSGITLISERPFEIGDWIEVEDRQGRVDQITWRSTRIVTRDNQSVVFPNSTLAASRIINLSRPDPLLGVRATVGVHYRTPPVETREALRRAVLGTPGVLARPQPAIRLREFGDSSLNWEIRFWVDDPERMENIRADVMQRIWYSLERARIEIPFPIRNLIMRDREWEGRPSPTEVQDQDRRRRNLELLHTVPILGPLPDKNLEWLAAKAQDEVYLEGERVTVQGEAGDRMFVIVEGEVRIAVNVDGTQEVEQLGPGQFFGEMSLLTGSARAATVIAASLLRVISLRARDLAPILHERPEFARLMADFAAERKVRLAELSAQVEKEHIARDLESTSSNLLADIMKFFKISGGSKGP